MNAAGYVVRPRGSTEEAAVLVPARVAARLVEDLRAIRGRRLGDDPELDVVTEALLLTGLRYAEEFRNCGTPSGTPELDDEDLVVPLEPMSSTAVAEAIGTTDRNVRALAARGTLRGSWDGRRWSFDPDDVAAYAERRTS